MEALTEVSSASGTLQHRSALAAVLRSKTFEKSPILCTLLEYLCVRQFALLVKPTKEYDIALDVFRRQASFDASTDSIVRVEMFRLRKKLATFYATEGSGERIRIVLQSGNYVPQFSICEVASEIDPAAAVDPGIQAAFNLLRLPPTRQPLRPAAWAAGVILILTVAALATHRFGTPVKISKAVTAIPKAALPPAATPDPTTGIRILCGVSQPHADRLGRLWSKDRFFTGGVATERPVQPILRTREPWMFSHLRSGDFSYDVPLDPGIYELRLFFAETPEQLPSASEGGENTRVFDIMLNGKPLLSGFDITADAGLNTADLKVFKDVSPSSDGKLHLKFQRKVDAPVLNAIEVSPGTPHRLHPIRIVMQNKPLMDSSGRAWAPDEYFEEGRSLLHDADAAGSEDPRLYQQERYGNFSYSIPVAEGNYTVALRFTESYWAPEGPGGGGLGSRSFDIYCNGLALQRSLDLFREAGFRHQLIKIFHHNRPNAQGKLNLSFVPDRNYAVVNAIEVNDESDATNAPTGRSTEPVSPGR